MRKGTKHTKEARRKIKLKRAKQVIPKEIYIQNGLKNRDELHFAFKGETAGYRAIHIWVETRLGKPDTCEDCGKTGLKGHQIHWANLNHQYRRNLVDWVRLCAQCHASYDKKK